MKVQRQGDRGIIKRGYCRFLVYDETSYDEETESKDKKDTIERMKHAPVPQGTDRNEFLSQVAEIANGYQKNIYRQAYGHPHLAYFTVHKDKPTTFELDGAKEYTVAELKKIMSLATQAKRRCKFGV